MKQVINDKQLCWKNALKAAEDRSRGLLKRRLARRFLLEDQVFKNKFYY